MPRKVKEKAPAPVVQKVYYRIQAKYAPDVFFPSNAVDESFWKRPGWSMEGIRFETLDGKKCIPVFQSTTNNRDGSYTERFDDFCQRKFGIPFVNLQSMWNSRLGYCDYYWHWVKLEIEE